MLFFAVLVILVPLLPLLVVDWVLTKLLGYVNRNVPGD